MLLLLLLQLLLLLLFWSLALALPFRAPANVTASSHITYIQKRTRIASFHYIQKHTVLYYNIVNATKIQVEYMKVTRSSSSLRLGRRPTLNPIINAVIFWKIKDWFKKCTVIYLWVSKQDPAAFKSR